MTCTCRRHVLGLALAAFAPEGAGGASAASAAALAAEPDSALCRACLGYLGRVSGPVMVRHCRRTYQFAAALGEHAGLRPDREVLYVASLLHDLGLEPEHDGPGDFETNGARAAEAFVAGLGEVAMARRVADAIDLHTSLSSAADPRPEVALLHMGAMVDVAGTRLDQLPPALVGRIVEEFPRDGTKALLASLLGRQIETKPGSRIGMLAHRMDVPGIVRSAPFAD